MSVNAGNVVIAIQAIDEASGVFGKIQASLGLLGNTLQGLGPGFSQIGSVISGFAVGGPLGAAVAGIGQVVQGLQFSVDAAGKLQTAWTDLQSTLHLTGPAWDTMKLKVDAFVESLRTTTTFSDTDLINAFQRLSTYGMTAAQAMDALRAATELAAAKHIDLETAATALGKAFQGNSMLLVRYGVDVSTVTKQVSMGTEAIKEMAVNLQSATTPQLTAFGDAMNAAGLKIQDASGKMLSQAAIAKEIETAWKAGAISGDQLSAIVGALGINFQGSKALAMDYANVLAQVNTQYGGSAQAQASTYAGLQERMGNAVQVLSEKIGEGLLPALSGMLEGLIPVVDGFTRGVGAIQDWIAAVAKIPAVKATTDVIGQAFAGLARYFEEAWASVSKDLMPALQELWSTLQDLWTTLKPVFDAFGELMSAFGSGSGDINVVQILLEGLVLAIKGLAEIIRLIIPVVRVFALGFKEAADILTPPLKMIVDAVGAFIDWLTNAFQGFYDWLVGHSLWQDLWNGLLTVIQNMGSILHAAVQVVFDLIGGVIKDSMTLVGGLITTGFQVAFDTVKGIVSGAVGVLQQVIGGVTTAIQAAVTTWKGLADGITQSLPSIQKSLAGIEAAIQTAANTIDTTWQSMLNTMVSATQTAFEAMVATISSEVDAIVAKLQAAANQVAMHSIWPDMLNAMVDQTQKSMGAIQQSFSQNLEGPAGIVPIVQSVVPAVGAGVAAAAPSSAGGGSTETSITTQVLIDGQLIQTALERRTLTKLKLQRAGLGV